MLSNIVRCHAALILARVLGLSAAITTMLLYFIFLFVNPYSQEGMTGGTYVISAIMISLAVLAAWGAFSLKPWMLFLAFVGSFVPVGFYFLFTPGIFAFIGVANLLYLFAGMMMFADRRGTRT